MKQMALVIGILAVVVVGALLFAGFYSKSSFAHGNGGFVGCLVEKFADDLELDTQQREQLTQIVEAVKSKHQEMHSLHAAEKKDLIEELRSQEIDREKLDSMDLV